MNPRAPEQAIGIHVFTDGTSCPIVGFDEQAEGTTTRNGFIAERTGTGVQVDDPCAVQNILGPCGMFKHVENSLPCAVGGRTCTLPLRRDNGATFQTAGDNPHGLGTTTRAATA